MAENRRLPLTDEELERRQLTLTLDEVRYIHCATKSYAMEFPAMTPSFCQELRRKAEIFGLDHIVELMEEELARIESGQVYGLTALEEHYAGVED